MKALFDSFKDWITKNPGSAAALGGILAAIAAFTGCFSQDLGARVYDDFSLSRKLPATIEAVSTRAAEEMKAHYETDIMPPTLEAVRSKTAEDSALAIAEIQTKYETETIPATVQAEVARTAGELLATVKEIAPVSLLSVSYKYGGWNPQLIDLRIASENGIPAWHNMSFQFFDLWISVPGEVPDGHYVQAVVFREPDLSGIPLGQTNKVPLEKGLTQINTIEVPGDEEDKWRFDDGYFDDNDSLYIALLVSNKDEEVVSTTVNRIRFNREGASLLADMPIGYIVSIVYSVNDGPEEFLDIPAAEEMGINASADDTITIHRVWYHAPKVGSYNSETEGHLSAYVAENISNDFPTAIYCKSLYVNLDEGIHELDLNLDECDNNEKQFRWQIPNDNQNLVLNLARKDGTILDRLVFRLNGSAGAPGLVSSKKPEASFVSLAYQINDGPEQPIDLRTVLTEGIGISPGDNLAISEIWYRSQGSDEQTEITAEGNILGESPAGAQFTSPTALTEGIHAFDDVTNLQWQVTAGHTALFLNLFNNEGHTIDQLIIPLHTEAESN